MGDRRVIHLVDDEESIRKAASFALKTAGYDVVTYASGVEFLKEAKSAAVGCVILDVRMPKMDGLEVQAAMAARGVNMPVIVLTGHGDVSVAVQAMKGGAVDFLEKPFEKAALLGAVSRAFARLDDVDFRTLETSERPSPVSPSCNWSVFPARCWCWPARSSHRARSAGWRACPKRRAMS